MKKQEILENEYLRVNISTLGKNVSILSIYNKKTGKEWIYSDKNKIKSRSAKESYDNQYFGGCEFLFPNDMPVFVMNKLFQDHGYLWTTDYCTNGVEETEEEYIIEYTGYIETLRIKSYVKVSLLKHSPKLCFSIILKNESENTYPYLLRLHPSFNVTESCQLLLNGKKIHFEGDLDTSYCSFQVKMKVQDYPIIDYDLGRFSIEEIMKTNVSELFCHIVQDDGSFTIVEGEEKIRVSYNNKDFPYITIYCINAEECIAIIEPDSGLEADLKKMIENGTAENIFPMQVKQYDVNIEVF